MSSHQPSNDDSRTVAEPMVLTGLSMLTRSIVQTAVSRDLIDEKRPGARTVRTEDGAVPVYKPSPNLDAVFTL